MGLNNMGNFLHQYHKFQMDNHKLLGLLYFRHKYHKRLFLEYMSNN